MNRRPLPLLIGEYVSFRLLQFLALALPVRLALRLGDTLGALAAALAPGRMRIAEENLLQAFPGMSPRRARAIAVGVFRHCVRGTIEVTRAQRVLRADNFRRFVRFRNEAVIDRVFESGRPAIWVTAHLGTWEIFGMCMAMRNARLTSVYRPLHNPWIDRLVRRCRTAMGQRMVERKGALLALLKVLRRGESHVGLLVDQHVRRGAVWVRFFGRPAATTPAPALLALRTGAPIVLWYTRRLPGTFRFEATVEEPIYVEPSGDGRAEILRVTEHISRRLEEFIKNAPEQWLWFHRRWRTPPEGAILENAHVKPSRQAL